MTEDSKYEQREVFVEIQTVLEEERETKAGSQKGYQIYYSQLRDKKKDNRFLWDKLFEWRGPELKTVVEGLKKGDKCTLVLSRIKPELNNGIKYWNIFTIKEGIEVPRRSGSAYDSTGVEKGHLINCALELLPPAKFKDAETIEKAMKAISELTKKMQGEYSDQHPASVGLAVKAGCSKGKNLKEAEELAKYILTTVEPLATSIVTGKPVKKEDPIEEAEDDEEDVF